MSSVGSNFQDNHFFQGIVSYIIFQFQSLPLTVTLLIPPDCHLIFDVPKHTKMCKSSGFNATHSLLTMIPDLPKTKIKSFYNSQNSSQATNVSFNAIWKHQCAMLVHNTFIQNGCSCMC